MTEDLKTLQDLKVPEGIFKDVKYYLVGSVPKEVEELLKKGKAKRDFYLSDMVTHAIADDDNDDDCCQARELFELPVVKSQWVILSVKCGSLLPTAGFSPESNNIFKGVVACASQLSSEDSKVLWALITYYGGSCSGVLDPSVTHVIDPEASGPKYEVALQHSERLSIVTPDWVMDCVQSKERLHEKCYHPRLLLTENEQASKAEKLEIKKEELDPFGMPMSPPMITTTASPNVIFKSDSTRTKQALAKMVSNRMSSQGSKPVLDPALLMKNQMNFAPLPDMVHSPPLLLPPPPPPVMPLPMPQCLPRTPGSPRGSPRGSRSPRVRGAGSPRGSPRGHLRNITNNSEGRPPRSPRGSGRGRSPGRGSAKISQIMTSFTRPLQPFLPGPMPPLQFGQMPGHAEMAVYYGHDPSETVPPELCLLGCVFYITDYHKYLAAHEIETWKQVIEQHGGQVDDSYSNRVTHVLCEHQKNDVFLLALKDGKRVITAHWLNDVLLKKKMQPPWLALHFPSNYTLDNRPCKNQIISVTNFEGEERTRVKHMISVIGAKYTGYLTHANSVLIARKQEGVKYLKACEWHIPVVNVQWINEILLGDLSPLKLPVHVKFSHFHMDDPFKVETWRVANFMDGWKIPIKVSKEAWKRFNPAHFLKTSIHTSQASDHSGVPAAPGADQRAGQKRRAEDDIDMKPPDKRQRSGPGTPDQQLNGVDCPVVLMTGIAKPLSESLAKDVIQLGGIVTQVPERCSHMVVPIIARTVKFFTAFSVVKYVITPNWIKQSFKAGKFLDEADFLLRDDKAEVMFNFNLQESLRRAQERKLFQDLVFYITPSVKPGKQPLRQIVASAGGQIVDKRPSLRHIRYSKTPQGKPSFIVISCDTDLHLCTDLLRRNLALHNAEFILTGIVKQEIDYEAYKIE